MSLKITEKNENKLLKRIEIKAEISFAEKATPSNGTITKLIASETKKPAENVVVKTIYTRYGDTSADVEAYVYNTKEDKENMEPTTKAMEDKAAAAAKAAAKPAEEKKEEKPAEAPAEKKEAPKEEPKAENQKEEKPKEEEKKEEKAEG